VVIIQLQCKNKGFVNTNKIYFMIIYYFVFFVLLLLIQKAVVNELSKKILQGNIDKTKPILADVFDGMVVFREG
jgi:hypothetical protein